MKLPRVIGTLLAALAFASSANLLAQADRSNSGLTYLIPNGTTVYDAVNGVTWLTDANLASTLDADSPDDPAPSVDMPPRFGLPLCNPDSTDDCIWPDGAMSYTSAQKWVKRMNAASYLGHDTWQLPTTPQNDSGCSSKGPSNNSFGFGCSAGALGSLYYVGIGITAPNTAVPIPPNTVGSVSEFPAGNLLVAFEGRRSHGQHSELLVRRWGAGRHEYLQLFLCTSHDQGPNSHEQGARRRHGP